MLFCHTVKSRNELIIGGSFEERSHAIEMTRDSGPKSLFGVLPVRNYCDVGRSIASQKMRTSCSPVRLFACSPVRPFACLPVPLFLPRHDTDVIDGDYAESRVD